MSFVIKDKGDYVYLKYSGPLYPAFFSDLITHVRDNRGPRSKVFADVVELAGTPDNLMRFNAGVEAAEKLRGIRLLMLTSREKINKLGENAAVNRGASIFTTDDEAQGLDWLLGSSGGV
jgi:hypothetical protein